MVAIVGIVLVAASVNLFPSDEQLSRRDAAELATAIERTRDTEWFGGMPTALSFQEGRARPWRLSGTEWLAQPGRDTALPALQVLAMEVDGQPLEANARLVFLPDGFGTPFRLRVHSRGLDWAIHGDAAGAVRVTGP